MGWLDSYDVNNRSNLTYQRPQKGGFFKDAALEGIAILFPDTSPRGANIEGEDDAWDFGTGTSYSVRASVHPI
jgi:hypothetical protein